MPPVLVQSAYNSVGKEESRRCTATFTRRTTPGSMVFVACAAAGTLPSDITGPAGFTRLGERGLRDIQAIIWYRPNCPAISSVSVRSEDADKSIQLRAIEYSGIAQENVLDEFNIESSDSDSPHTGFTGTTDHADQLVLAVIVNQYASTAQYGYWGGLTKLYDSTSPQRYDGDSDSDWERSRMTVHQAIPNRVGNFGLFGRMSSDRRWAGFIFTFRGGSLGPARMTSRQQPPILTTSGGGDLTVFGPLVSKVQPPILTTSGGGWIGPFNYQYRLGGRRGLLVGSGTKYHVEGTDGLGGWQVRTSDDDLPRGDGALRGIDLQAARELVFKMNVGKGRDEVERNMQDLYRALVPQRDEDWELLFRFPTLPLQMMRVRPTDLNRARDSSQLQFASQSFALRAADPRHYAATPKRVQIPNTPTATADPVKAQVVNIGNTAAYPIITVRGPASGEPVTRIQLVNDTALVNFEASLLLLPGALLRADMDARITGAPRSVITLDGQSKYGAWLLPREPFRVDPDPTGFGGFNEVYLRTEPAGAPVDCWLEYRDTWAG
jgi:hypothetical protein